MGRRSGSLYICLSMFFQLVLLFNEAGATGKGCSHIYKGFAECLLKLGDSLAKSIEGESEEVKELDTVCRSWDNFHACADSVLEGCPEDAASIWESLRKESRKLQFQGNLHELCSSRVRPSGTMESSDGSESNRESLRGSAGALWCGLTSPVLSIAVMVANL
ncbi:neuritin-like protein [Amblyraja radiata]|uniref:neuritin-like protein n=1 Tax=Amblyraja radiata TaxID=386614 RepID=UPI0014035913|nr:neuritin-like protein [Amblyraja radiata]